MSTIELAIANFGMVFRPLRQFSKFRKVAKIIVAAIVYLPSLIARFFDN